jgi:papain fold toxin 2 of polymorphic toxin system
MKSKKLSALQIAAKAARGFEVKECEKCAEKVKKALVAAGHRGKLIEIRGAGGGDFMICLSYKRGQTTITQNGRHMGIQVEEMVFDNLHPKGMPFEKWLKDFDAIGGVEIYSMTDF